MKGALLKKRYGIPAALLLVLLSSGAVVAWYAFNTIGSTTTVKEPLSSSNNIEFSAIMYPGQSNIWSFDIKNSADVGYAIKADLTFKAPSGVSITHFVVGIADETNDLTEDNSAEFSILPGGTLSCSMTIKAAKDATPGEVSAEFVLSRG